MRTLALLAAVCLAASPCYADPHRAPDPRRSDEAFGILVLGCQPGRPSISTCTATKVEFLPGATTASCETEWEKRRAQLADKMRQSGDLLAGHFCIPFGLLVVPEDSGDGT